MIEEVFAALPIGREKAIGRLALAASLQISEWKAREVLAVLISEGRVVFVREARNDRDSRFVYWRDEWLPVETMPIGRSVIVKTPTGKERLAQRRDYSQVRVKTRRQRGPGVACYVEPAKNTAVVAIGWREP